MLFTHQTGITAKASRDAIFVTLNVNPGRHKQVRQSLKQLPEIISIMQEKFNDADLHATIAIGSEYWSQLSSQRPKLLTGFIEIDEQQAPSTPVDLALHIRSNRKDITYLLTQEIYSSLKSDTSLIDEVACFKYLDNRDLTGFVDGTENPTGENRADVALIGEEDTDFIGGSYLHLQKFIHNLDKWKTITQQNQEDIIGRTKEDNIEYASNKKSLHAHTKRASIKDEQGVSLEILRQSMPFASLQESGLMFASYCKTPNNFNLMLKSMIIGDQEGNTDHLMRYTQAVTGQAFFVPNIEWFHQL
ncbi:Dyp-type peroxidase [Marinomonas sp. 2405UD68-3]|uniref:Dyp-type peroxidase n=1 Tax=Marinomonas sp. 2405UD68-3 TaxID=3391835 RepID=UPI0039C8E82E